jgi:hypothetical protein
MSTSDDEDDDYLFEDIGLKHNQPEPEPVPAPQPVAEKETASEKKARTLTPTKKAKSRTRKVKRVFSPHEKQLLKMAYRKMTEEEEAFLRSLDTIDRLWGYEGRTKYERDTHEIPNIVGLQKFTDPIFRIIAKLKKRSKVDQMYEVGGDIYGKIKQQVMNLPVNKDISVFVKKIFSKGDGFAEEMETLAHYPASSFPMKMIAECALAVVMMADPKRYSAEDVRKRVLQNVQDVKFLEDNRSEYNKKAQTAKKWREVQELDSPDRRKKAKFTAKIRRKTKFDPFLPTSEKGQKILFYSNPEIVKEKAQSLGYPEVFLSTRKEKKYMIQTPEGGTVHFGQMGYEDFTKHNDSKRRENYLRRSGKIKGDWKLDPYSPNTLARKLLW